MRIPVRTTLVAAITLLLVAGCAASASAPSGAPDAAPTEPPVAVTATPPTPAPVPTTQPSASAAPEVAVDTPYGYEPTDAKGDERVVGTWKFYGAGSSDVAGHDGVGSFELILNDPRVSGYGHFDFGMRQLTEVAPTWGQMTVLGPDGDWAGDCTGAHWREPSMTDTAVMISCWLLGTEEYAGTVFYLQLLGGPDQPMRVDGMVYPGSIPDPKTGI